MRDWLIAFALLACALLAQARADEPPTLFRQVHVVTLEPEGPLMNRDVLVENGVIERIAPGGTLAPGADTQVIEARDRWLMPGLAEMHAHIPGQLQADYARRVLTLFAVNGVTTIRGMLGEPWHLELRESVARGGVLGPRIFTSGPSFNARTVTFPEQAARRVREQAAAGYDFLKMHPGLTREEFEAVADAASAAGIRFEGHVQAAVGIRRTLESGQHAVDHLDGYLEAMAGLEPGQTEVETGFFGSAIVERVDPAGMPGLVEATRRSGVWMVPTEVLIEDLFLPVSLETLLERPELVYMPPDVVARWAEAKRRVFADPAWSPELGQRFVALRRQLIGAMHDAGVQIALGSDAPQIFNVPGWSTHDELEALVASGLTPTEALRAGTIDAQRLLRNETECGRVAEGLCADLVLLGSDPTVDVAHAARPLGVMLAGRWLDRSALDALLAGLPGGP